MSNLSFQPVQDGLYSAIDTTTKPVLAYWLLLSGTPPAGNLDSSDLWNTYSGCFFFIPADKPIQDVSTFVQALTAKLSPPQLTTRWLAWISDPSNVAGSINAVNANVFTQDSQLFAQTIQALTIPFANIQFLAPNGSTMSYGGNTTLLPDGSLALFLQSNTAGGFNQIALMRNGASVNTTPFNGLACVPLNGPLAGTARFDAQWDRGDFYQFMTDDPNSFDNTLPNTNEIRYFYGAQGSEQFMHYPVFPPQAQTQDPTMQLALNVYLDPFNVWDSSRTRFGLDVTKMNSMGAVVPNSNYFSSTDGHVFSLVPQQGAGYALGIRPQVAQEPASPAYSYLTPVGLFDVAPAEHESHGLAGADPTSIRHLMCGMTGTEYLISDVGATVEFVTGNTAYAQGFTAASSGNGAGGSSIDPCTFVKGSGGRLVAEGGLLTDTFTTSWLRINPSLAPTPGVTYGYAVQPEAAVYYSKVNKPQSSPNSGTPYPYPMALGCRISILDEDTKPQAPVPLPMASYGGVWLTGADPTTLPTSATLTSFESQIVGTTRHHTAPKDMVNGPTFFDPVTHQGVDGGYAKTPEGLLAQLNDKGSGMPGTFNTIFLAKSPNHDPPPVAGAEELAFQPPSGKQVVNPILSNALMNDNLFMVATNYYEGTVNPPTVVANNPFGTFLNEIQMGEWTFRLDVGYSPPTAPTVPRTILLFKFTTALSVFDLVNNQTYWQNWTDFIATDSEGTAQDKADNIQVALNQAFCQAKPNEANPDEGIYFADFWAKIHDPNWTGILAINCGLDAADLPIDLQDLLGGIDGELRAHHFGVTVNQVEVQEDLTWAIDKSSMFALVYYDKDYTPLAADTFGFQVLRLNALFENSTLTHFDSKIAVTIPRLFGEIVTLEGSTGKNTSGGPANVLEINGVYQKHGDTGTVVFDTKTPEVFSFTDTTKKIRAIQEMYVTDAALVPVSSTSDGAKDPTITVISNLALAGDLMFIPNLDTDTTHPVLDIFSYGSDPTTGLGFNTYNIAMTTTIFDNVGHLAAGFPKPDISSFAITPALSTVRKGSLLAALPLKLSAFVQGPSSDGWPVEFIGQSEETFEADFALSFQASLGSLGALSAFADSLDVDLMLGWNIAGNDTTDNQIWLLMVPPKTMLGQLGFGIQGVLNTTFTNVQLVSTKWAPPTGGSINTYGIYFKNVGMQLLGIPLIPPPPAAQSNFTLFAKPVDDPATGTPTNMGWLMTLKVVNPGG